MGFISDVKKALGIVDGGGRAARINAATRDADTGVATEGNTIGNPQGTIKKKPKPKPKPKPAVPPQTSRIPTTLRG